MRIERVLETHTHADHVSGHGRFALEHGLPVAIHRVAEPEYPSEPLEDGQVVTAGEVSMRVVHTPGHRPEHCSFVVDGELALPATRCSSATPPGPISRSRRAKAPRTSTTRSAACSISATTSRSIRATSPARSAAGT